VCLNRLQEFQADDGNLMNLLLEAYLEQWTKNKDDIVSREKILALLSKAPNCPTWDWPRALLACKMVSMIFYFGPITPCAYCS
jgi:hypothetical protein